MERLTKYNEERAVWLLDDYGDDDSDVLGDAIDKLADYEDAEEQGLLLRLPCKVGDTVYVICECENISAKLDGSLYSSDGSPGTATGYYCPYEDDCPFIDFSDDCEMCKNCKAVFEDTVTHILVETEVNIFTENCNTDGRHGTDIFLTREEAEKALADMGV